MAKNSELGYFNLVPPDPPKRVLTEDEERMLRIQRRSAAKDRQEAWRLAQHRQFKAGVLEGRMCGCNVCWAFLSMLGIETQKKAKPGKRCGCVVCVDGEEVAPEARLERCCCPGCTPWLNADGRLDRMPIDKALDRIDGKSAANPTQLVARTVEERKAEQARLMATVLEVGPQAVELLKHVIDQARENPEFLKTGARAAIDVLRLGLPMGWDKETDPDAQTRFLAELKGTMQEYRVLIQAQMEARAKGLVIVTDKESGRVATPKESKP